MPEHLPRRLLGGITEVLYAYHNIILYSLYYLIFLVLSISIHFLSFIMDLISEDSDCPDSGKATSEVKKLLI